jgi:uncharacterized protein
MKSKLISHAPQRTYAVVFDQGDEVLENLLAFAKARDISAAGFTGLGALSDVVLGYFDWQKKDYRRIALDEQVEVLVLTGNVALKDGEPSCIRTSWSAHRTAGRTAAICSRATCGRRWN